MSNDGGHLPDDTPTAPERSAAEVDDAVDRAAAGADGGGTLRPPEQSHPGTAPVEQTVGDEAMTQGRGDGATTGEPAAPDAPPPGAAVGGAMQSAPGPRASDQVASTVEDED